MTIFTLFHAGPSRTGAALRFWRAFGALDALRCCVSSPIVRGAGAGAGRGMGTGTGAGAARAGAITGGAWHAGNALCMLRC